MKSNPESRFWPKVEETSSGCWLWKGGQRGSGYGGFYNGKRQTSAHIFSWELINGPLPKEMTLDHLCANIRCVNPAHLELVTRSENSKRQYERELRKRAAQAQVLTFPAGQTKASKVNRILECLDKLAAGQHLCIAAADFAKFERWEVQKQLQAHGAHVVLLNCIHPKTQKPAVLVKRLTDTEWAEYQA